MNYQYWAKAANGKSVRGRKSAENEEELLEWIRDKGWVPINIVRTYETVARIGDSFGKNVDLSLRKVLSLYADLPEICTR